MSTAARILVVDDTPANVILLEDMLTARGYEVTTASDGVEALEKIAAGAPDLVLLDIMMPRMSGYEVLERLRAETKLREIPVIMISAVDQMESVIRCVELGAEDYLPKPFNGPLLRARVGASLEKKALRDQVRASLQRLEQELAAARKLQLGMLPDEFPAWSPERPVDVYALVDPAREVGGDLYDFFDAGDGLFAVLVGDVSGKGAPAAMFMARAQSLVRMAVQLSRRGGATEVSPAAIANAANRELYQKNRDRMFVTIFLGFLDTKTGALTYVNAGHPPPYLLHCAGGIQKITSKPEVPLAARAEHQYQDRDVTLQPGDTLFVYTDGVFEAMNSGEEFYGAGRLEADLRAACSATPEVVVRTVKQHVDTFAGQAPRADDITMLAVRWQPAALPTATEVVIVNDIAQLARISEAMDRIGAEHEVADKALMHLQVALDEIVSNIIKYAWQDHKPHEISIRIAVLADGVRVDILDDGVAFDPRLSQPPERPTSGPRQLGGLGIHIVKQLVDSLEYARVDGRNQLTLIKRCTVRAPGR